MPRLEIRTQGNMKIVAFDGPQFSIGRQEGNDLVITDPAASRKHCVLQNRNGSIKLTDLKSHNGTWMGENRILEANVSIGDTLRIGGTFIRILPDEVETASPEV